MQLNGHSTCLLYRIGRNIFTREVKSSDMFPSHCTISGHIFVHDKPNKGHQQQHAGEKGGARCSTILIGDVILKTTKFILAIKIQNRLCHSSCTFCQNDKLGLFSTFQKHCRLEDLQDLLGFLVFFFYRCKMILLVSSKQCNSICFCYTIAFL